MENNTLNLDKINIISYDKTELPKPIYSRMKSASQSRAASQSSDNSEKSNHKTLKRSMGPEIIKVKVNN